MVEEVSAIAKRISYRAKERMSLFRSYTLSEQSAIFTELSPFVQQAILADLTVHEAVDLLDHLDLHTAEVIVTQIKNGKQRSKIVRQLKSDIREKIEYFLRFHPKATLGLMHLNYVLLPHTFTIGEAGDAIDEYHEATGRFPLVLVHQEGKLLGEVPMATLVRKGNALLLERFVEDVPTISYQADIDEVFPLFSKSEHKKAIVLDHDQSVIGIVFADDVKELFADLPEEALYSVSGVDSAERPTDEARDKFRRRYRWLVVNLGTAFLAGSVVLLFQGTINALTVLSMYIPIVAGTGGVAASQSFAVMLRGITLGSVSFRNVSLVLSKEISAGFLNGLVIGGLVAVVSMVLHQSWLLGVVVGITMVLQHMAAATAGTIIPLFIKHIGRDPASISNIFISTVTDVFGIATLLILGTLILL